MSPNEHSNYEIVWLASKINDGKHDDNDKDDRGKDKDDRGKDKDDNKTANTFPVFFENTFNQEFLSFGSAGEDCATGVILGTMANQNPTDESKLYIADLSRVKPTYGSPAGRCRHLRPEEW